ncbi:TPA: hypothetical protein U2Q63_003524 [Citrobacter koseri]|uniref:hypothetical protein n=1 Tax=Citrobacter koseri TaxID=545 RepID=UPI002AB446BA|nr:hypothetical protein [Citrobacter koseri]HEM6875096.1 hypothetical protein [Citrobacter koseri]HEM8586569.1 hypothetical protein [Citrobacter koseri]
MLEQIHREAPGATLFLRNFIPQEGFEVFKFCSSAFAIFLLSGCCSDAVISPPQKPEYKSMPEITQSVTPSQQRAIMSGERPDWSERAPVNTMKRY